MTTNEELFTRALGVIPGGVDSPVRAYGSVGGVPPFITSAKGAYVKDATGREYVDLVCSWGPALLGHSHPAVIEAVQKAAAKGLSFGAPTEAEVELAELIRSRVSAAERVRFVSTGTEATMTAMRLARGATGRDLIVKFAGCYHGHSDALLAAAGSGVATGGLPGSAGVPAAVSAQTIVLPYHDEVALEECFATRGQEIAAVICEGAPANMGVVDPGSFNLAIRRVTEKYGALMILDEVLTGFRVSAGGMWGLRSVSEGGWSPDLFAFGKVVGGGMPLAAVGGRADVMNLLAPLGPVYQAGTLSGNPLATAAGIATLKLADQGVYDHVDSAAQTVIDIVSSALVAEGVPFGIQRAGSLFSIAFGDEAAQAPLINYAQMQAQDTWRHPAFFHAFLDAGVSLPPSLFEAWFVSASHGEREFEAIATAAPIAARAAARAVKPQ